jgi:nucleoside-diphosphate-sugar epimerase
MSTPSDHDPRLPDQITSEKQLEELLSRPTDYVIDAISRTSGDILILGVAGKMGPTLARMAKRALDQLANSPRAPAPSSGSPRDGREGGSSRKVIGVARFSNPAQQAALEMHGIETIRADLLDPKQLEKLPDAPNVIYMPAMKFGSTGQEALTWAMNTYLPGMCAQRFAGSKIVAFSTGNIYGLSPVVLGGSSEDSPLNPVGDYAMSCLGRERMFEHFSRVNGTQVALIRLNYATEMRYGVLVDVAQKIFAGEEIDLSMGCLNAIWQGDANSMALAALDQAASPPFVLNVAGPELLSLRKIAGEFASLMNKPVRFIGEESSDALISNGQLGHRLFGYPSVPAGTLIRWISRWVVAGGSSLGKPTHFEARDGKY